MSGCVRNTILSALILVNQLGCASRGDDASANREPAHVLRAPSSGPEVVIDWNVRILRFATTSGLPPAHSYRVSAISHLAMHDAVNTIEPRYETLVAPAPGPRTASLEAAAIAAARGALARLIPNRTSDIDAEYTASLAAVPNGTAKDHGVAVGDAAAAAVVASRSNDGWFATATYTFGSGAGAYQLTPPSLASPILVHLPNATPLLLKSASQFRPPPPPSPTSNQYAADLNEVKALGRKDNTVRTPEQTEIGRFWFEGELTSVHRMARQVVSMKTPNLHDSARTFALTATAISDGLLAVFDAKYHYSFWRPVTAIRAVDTKSSAMMQSDSEWLPDGWTGGPGGRYITPFHPEYPSGHAGIGPAGMYTLVNLFGDDIPLDLTSTSLPGVTRHFAKISDAAAEICVSRIYVGYHFRTTVQRSEEMGRQLGKWLVQNSLRTLKAKR